jgi:hypothetical protein
MREAVSGATSAAVSILNPDPARALPSLGCCNLVDVDGLIFQLTGVSTLNIYIQYINYIVLAYI